MCKQFLDPRVEEKFVVILSRFIIAKTFLYSPV